MLIARTLTAAAVLISIPGWMGFYSLFWVVYYPEYVFTLSQIPQVWRLVTSFLITGPKLGMIMDPFFLYQYSSKLEKGNPRFGTTAAYAVYCFFIWFVILVSRCSAPTGLTEPGVLHKSSTSYICPSSLF